MKIIANNYKEKEIMKIIREWTKLTQKDFADTLNVSTKTIQGYELGTRKYKFETLIKIAQKHDITIKIEKK